jgi:hypothetical protein
MKSHRDVSIWKTVSGLDSSKSPVCSKFWSSRVRRGSLEGEHFRAGRGLIRSTHPFHKGKDEDQSSDRTDLESDAE